MCADSTPVLLDENLLKESKEKQFSELEKRWEDENRD